MEDEKPGYGHSLVQSDARLKARAGSADSQLSVILVPRASFQLETCKFD